MVTIYPFTGLHPSDAAFSFVPSVPYDVISAEEAAAEIAKNDKTFLRVIRTDAELPEIDPHDNRIYERAREMFAQMKRSGLLVSDDTPTFYIYRITLDGETFTGLICCVSVAEYKDDTIKKHELTRYDKEEDRTRHIDAVSAHTGQVFLLYKDPGSVHAHISALADAMQPFGEYRSAGGNLHQIYRVSDPAEIAGLETIFAEIPNLYIADGHHRSAAASRYAKEHDFAGESRWYLAVAFPASQLKILPYNRLVADLNGLTAEALLEKAKEVLREKINQ